MRARRVVGADDGKVRRLQAWRTGCGKLAYAGRKIAAAKAKEQTRLSGELIEHYRCGACHAWHIGHPPGSRGEHSGRWAS